MGDAGLLVDPNDEAVLHTNYTAKVPAVPVLVADHHDGLAEIAVEPGEEVQDRLRGRRVKICAGLVREDDRGFVDESPRDRNPLLLAPRELVLKVIGPIQKADLVQDLAGRPEILVTPGTADE